MKGRTAEFAINNAFFDGLLFVSYVVYVLEWMLHDVLMEELSIYASEALDKHWVESINNIPKIYSLGVI